MQRSELGGLPQDLDRRFLRQFHEVDPSQIGRRIGEGNGHMVYVYGEDQVVKVPKRNFWNNIRPAEEKQWELAFAEKFYPEHVLDTTIVTSANNPYYVLLQRRLQEFSNVSPFNLPEVRAEFEEMMRRNGELIRRYGLSLDPLGREGWHSSLQSMVFHNTVPQISNILIEKTDQGSHLVLPDFSLLKLRSGYHPNTPSGIRDHAMDVSNFIVNRHMIKRKFGIDIAPRPPRSRLRV